MCDKSAFRPGRVVIIEECVLCQGHGHIINPVFEACRSPDHPSYSADCDGLNRCPDAGLCWYGETVVCPVCQGRGK